MKIEETIELAMQDIMQARTYISTNSIPVVRYRDRLTSKGDEWVDCHAMPIDRQSPNHNKYRLTFELSAISKSQSDLRSNELDELIDECNEEIQQDLTPAALQAAINTVDANSDITVDGLIPTEGTEVDGEYQQFITSIDIFLTYTP